MCYICRQVSVLPSKPIIYLNQFFWEGRHLKTLGKKSLRVTVFYEDTQVYSSVLAKQLGYNKVTAHPLCVLFYGIFLGILIM